MSMRHGTKTAPMWVYVLEAAERWSQPPWFVVSSPGRLIWWLRWREYRNVEVEVNAEQAKKVKSRGRR